MQGALTEVPVDECGRAIGILRKSGPKPIDTESGQRWKCVYVFTGLGDDRNLLNGLTSDILVAMVGGPGTLSEIVYAHLAGRPIVFLESIDQLKHVFEKRPSKLERIVSSIKDNFHDVEITKLDQNAIECKLNSLLNNPANIALTAEEAIDVAIGAVAKIGSKSNYPDADNAPPKRKFDEKLKWLSEKC